MESNLSNAPFYIGQEVVALKTSPNVHGIQILKDSLYVVGDCIFCTNCQEWVIKLKGLFFPSNITNVTFCCTSIPQPDNGVWGWAKYFAPHNRLRHQNVEITKEILQLEIVEERVDVSIRELIQK